MREQKQVTLPYRLAETWLWRSGKMTYLGCVSGFEAPHELPLSSDPVEQLQGGPTALLPVGHVCLFWDNVHSWLGCWQICSVVHTRLWAEKRDRKR